MPKNDKKEALGVALEVAERLEKVVDAVTNDSLDAWISDMINHIHSNDTGDVMAAINFLAEVAKYRQPDVETDNPLVDGISHAISVGPIVDDVDDEMSGNEVYFIFNQKLFAYTKRGFPLSSSQQLGKEYQFMMVLARDEDAEGSYRITVLAYTHDLIPPAP